MKTEKQQYLQNVRATTVYPTYRGIIGILTILGYLLAGIYLISGVVGGLMALSESFVMGLGFLLTGVLSAVILFVGVRFLKEAALILVDIGDSVTDHLSKEQNDSPSS